MSEEITLYNAYKQPITNKPNLEYITLQDNFDEWRNKINLSISKIRSVEEFPAITCKMMETADNYVLDLINYSFVVNENNEVEYDASGNANKIITEPRMAWVSMGDIFTEYGVVFNQGNADILFNSNLTVNGNLFVYGNSSLPYISLYSSKDSKDGESYRNNTSIDFYSLIEQDGKDALEEDEGSYKFLRYIKNTDHTKKYSVNTSESIRTSQIKECYEYKNVPHPKEEILLGEIEKGGEFSERIKEQNLITGEMIISTADKLTLDARNIINFKCDKITADDIVYFYNKNLCSYDIYQVNKSNTQFVIPTACKIKLANEYDFIIKDSVSDYKQESNIFQYNKNDTEDTEYRSDTYKIRKVAFTLSRKSVDTFTDSDLKTYDSIYTPFTIEEHYNPDHEIASSAIEKRNNYSTITFGKEQEPTNVLLYGKTFISNRYTKPLIQKGDNYSEYYENLIKNGGLKPYTKTENGIEPTLIVNGEILSTRVYNAVYNDYAEYFERGEETEPGDIIALDESRPYKEQYIKATSKSHCVVGVHSDTYGHIIGGIPEQLNDFIPVGLCGRVKVKVRGEVHYGDKIVPSNIPGVGKVYEPEKDDPENIIGFLVECDKITTTRKLRMKIK